MDHVCRWGLIILVALTACTSAGGGKGGSRGGAMTTPTATGQSGAEGSGNGEATATPGGGLAMTDAVKQVDAAFSTYADQQTLWHIQPGLSTVMLAYANRVARLYTAAQAGNWDMAKYQLEEMGETLDVGEVTRPAHKAALDSMQTSGLSAVSAAIDQKSFSALSSALPAVLQSCDACHAATGITQFANVGFIKTQMPVNDPASYVNWSAGAQNNFQSAAPAAPSPAPPDGPATASGVVAYLTGILNGGSQTDPLWKIQPGMGGVMMEYGDRWARAWYAAHAGNWDMAKYQLEEMAEIAETGATTRPKDADLLNGFASSQLPPVEAAIDGRNLGAFESAFTTATGGCNGCHAAASNATWTSFRFINVQIPTADPADYIRWDVGGGPSTALNSPATPPQNTTLSLQDPVDSAQITKLINSVLASDDSSFKLWAIQPGLGTVMMEYGKRLAQCQFALRAGNFDMAQYQINQAIQIQGTGQVTRPKLAPALTAFQNTYLEPLLNALKAKDGNGAAAAMDQAIQGCNGCHQSASNAKWSSFAFISIQPAQTDPADYVVWAGPPGGDGLNSVGGAGGNTSGTGGISISTGSPGNGSGDSTAGSTGSAGSPGIGANSALNPPALTACVQSGMVFNRGTGACSNVPVATFPCTDSGVGSAFQSAGVNISNQLTQFEGQGYKVDQCGALNGQPLVTLYQTTVNGNQTTLSTEFLCVAGSAACL